MAASTPRFGLYLPGGGSTGLVTPDEPADIDKLNDNFRSIDGFLGALTVTSTTRPAVPRDGMLIYETDTRNLLVWQSAVSRWAPAGPVGAASNALRDGLYPTPQVGDGVVRTDRAGKLEVYNGTTWLYADRTVAPTSVAAGSGTAAIQADGSVVFTGVASTSLTFTGIFSAAYDSYELLWDFSSSSVAQDIVFRMRAGAVDSAVGYGYVGLDSTTAAGPTRNANGATAQGIFARAGAASGGVARMTIHNPFAARPTRWIAESTDSDFAKRDYSGSHTPATSYDSMTVIFAGTTSGKVSIRGM